VKKPVSKFAFQISTCSATARQQDREQRLSAKRKFAELESSIERLAVRVVESADARDVLSQEADVAAEASEEAETRRKTMQAGRSVRETAPGRQRGGPPPFDASAFAAVAAKRKLEIVNKQCLVSLRQLMQHKWAFPFLKPVNFAALGLPTYPQVVKSPMDLGSVEAGIKKGGVYGSCEEVHRDISLTFANAKLFNPPETDVHVMAATLDQFWAPRWDAICERVKEVEEGMNVEKEAAEKKSAEMSARHALAAEEMKCAGLMADLDQLKRSLEDLKRTSVRITKPMDDGKKTKLGKWMAKLPRGFRCAARDMIAETEGLHVVPEGAFDDDGWREICDDLGNFGSVAHRRLARFAKVRRRNATATRSGWCGGGKGKGGGGGGGDFDFGDETEEEGADVDAVVSGDRGAADGQHAVASDHQEVGAAAGGDVAFHGGSDGGNNGGASLSLHSHLQQSRSHQSLQRSDSVEETLAAAAAAAAAAVTVGLCRLN
jgi:hypothetical protein